MIETIVKINQFGNFDIVGLINGKPQCGYSNIQSIERLNLLQTKTIFKLSKSNKNEK